MEGFQALRPADKRPKLPLSEYHIREIFKYCVDINNYTDLLPGCAVLLGYALLLRPGEIGYQKNSIGKNLYNKTIKWHPNFMDPKEISIKVEASKTNRWKNKTEIIYTKCNCKNRKRITPCPVHLLKHWISIRNKYHKRKFKPNDFLFIHTNKKPFQYDHLNNWLQNAIAIVAKKRNIKMDPSKYPPHSLRQGGCTDMARHNIPSWRIEMKGRWRSKMWKTTYINTDWRDIATLSGIPVTTLFENITSQPVDN